MIHFDEKLRQWRGSGRAKNEMLLIAKGRQYRDKPLMHLSSRVSPCTIEPAMMANQRIQRDATRVGNKVRLSYVFTHVSRDFLFS